MIQPPVQTVEAHSTSASPKETHIPSLDGIRAISIALVLLGHLNGTRGFGRVDLGIGNYAHLGVLVFFVISGFLITRLLSSELTRYGRVSLKLFYARRALRLFPAAYVFIACVAVLSREGVLHLTSKDLWHSVTYTMNYLPGRSWEVGHLWSLSIEEQFYLLWPCAFVLLGLRRAPSAAFVVILLGPVARSACGVFLRGTPYRYLEFFPTVADSLAIGCVLALLSNWLELRGWYLQLFRPIYSCSLLALLLLINRYSDYTVVAALGTSVVNVIVAILIHRSVYCSKDWTAKILNSQPVAFIGLLSYSLYLWQELFLNRNAAAWVNSFPQNLVLAVTAALASFFLLEKPLLKLRHRLRR